MHKALFIDSFFAAINCLTFKLSSNPLISIITNSSKWMIAGINSFDIQELIHVKITLIDYRHRKIKFPTLF